MQIEVDNLNGKITTDNQELLDKLVELYSFNVEGAYFTKAYKRGWDGKKQFITNTGKFKRGLLPRILEDLKKVDIYPEVKYNFKSTNPSLAFYKEIPEVKLRDYQVKYVTEALSKQRGIVKSSTGSGKTLILASLINTFSSRKILVLFHRKQLLLQTYKYLTEVCHMENIGLAFGEGYIDSNIMLVTYQSIEKILGTPVEKPDVLLVDECHEFCNGKFTSKLINLFPTAEFRFGFTATVPTDKIKQYTLEGAFGPVIEVSTTQELIKEGYLAKPVIQLLTHTFSTSASLSYIDLYKEAIVRNEVRNNLILKIINTIRHLDPKIVIVVNSLEHAQILNNLIPNSIEVEGKHSLEERNKAIQKFINEKNVVLIGTNILQTGINITQITHLINARGLKSDISTIQLLGRCMRVDKDKEVYCYDILDKGMDLLTKHARSRIRAYKREGHEVDIIKELK